MQPFLSRKVSSFCGHAVVRHDGGTAGALFDGTSAFLMADFVSLCHCREQSQHALIRRNMFRRRSTSALPERCGIRHPDMDSGAFS
jgi:hypothetical protein